MEYRHVGNSDLKVSAVGLGCMSLGTEESKAKSIIEAALDLGVNYLDTADLYDFGLNEEFVGKAIKDSRQNIVLATKVGNRWNDQKDGWHWDPSKEYIKSAVKASLKRLQTDYIDLYQLHGGTIEDPIDETIEAFEDLKQEGVIRYYGISSIRPNVIQQYLQKSSIVSVMMQYSILDRRPEELLGLLEENHVSVMARGPLAKGLLTNSWKSKISSKGYLQYSKEELSQTLSAFQNDLSNRPLEEYGIQYCLHPSAVAAAVPGASTIEQVRSNVRAASAEKLTDYEIKVITSIFKSDQYNQHR